MLGSAAVVGVAVLAVVLGVGPRFLPYRTSTVEGRSMTPTLPLGSEIVLRPVAASKLRVGDIITFHKPNQPSELVTHRIVRIERTTTGRRFVTKGDANAVPDSWRVPAVGTGWREAFEVPYVGYLVQGLREPLVRLGVAVLVVLSLTALALRRIWASSGA